MLELFVPVIDFHRKCSGGGRPGAFLGKPWIQRDFHFPFKRPPVIIGYRNPGLQLRRIRDISRKQKGVAEIAIGR